MDGTLATASLLPSRKLSAVRKRRSLRLSTRTKTVSLRTNPSKSERGRRGKPRRPFALESESNLRVKCVCDDGFTIPQSAILATDRPASAHSQEIPAPRVRECDTSAAPDHAACAKRWPGKAPTLNISWSRLSCSIIVTTARQAGPNVGTGTQNFQIILQ